MKGKLKVAIAIAVFIAMTACAGAQAQILFSDNFQPQHFNQPDINEGYDQPGYGGIIRQEGTYAPLTWNERPETAASTGDYSNQTIIWHPWGDQELEFLCTAQSWGGDMTRYVWASPNHNFIDSSHLEIEFDMDPNAYNSQPSPVNWGGVIVGAGAQGTYIQPGGGNYGTVTSTGIGFSLSYTGDWTVYQDNSVISTGTYTGAHDGWYHIKVTIDAADFSGSTATIKFFVDGTQVFSHTKPDGLTSNYITLAGFSECATGYQNVFFDNFVVKLPPADTTPPVTTASPDGGEFFEPQTVTLTVNEPATIYYTTNGTTPTTSSPVYSTPIEVNEYTVVKFFAKDTAGNYETPQTEVYNIGPIYFTDNFQPQHFLQYDINEGYNLPGYGGIIRQGGSRAPMIWNERPETSFGNEYDSQTIIWHNVGDQELEFLCTGQLWGGPETKYVWASPNYNFTDTGKLDIEFRMDPQAYGSNTDVTGWGGVIIGTDAPGTYIIPLMGDYFTAQSGGVGFSLSYDGSVGGPTSGSATWTVYEDSLTLSSGQLDFPHDGWYDIKVRIDTAAFDGSPATLKFIVDGYQVYSYVKQNGFTSNYITLAGFSDNDHGYGNVFFDDFSVMRPLPDVEPPVTTPTPAPGVYTTAQSVSLIVNEPATIYYTTDSSEPTTSSNVYSGPITISQSTMLRFFAVDSDGNPETPKKVAHYTIPTSPIVFLDNYSVSGSYNHDINYEYDSGTRQSGSAAPLQYLENPFHATGGYLTGLTQLNAAEAMGGLSIFSSGNWGDDSSYPWASPNKNFKDSGQVTIEFDMNPNANGEVAPSGIWAGVVFGTDVPGAFVWPQRGTYGTAISPSGGMGFTIDDTGQVYIFEDDWPNLRRGNVAVHPGAYHIKVVIDTPGFGSGQPANIGLYIDGTSVFEYTRTAGFNNNYITFAGNSINGVLVQHAYDNLLITGSASYTNVPTIKDAKNLSDGTLVALTDKVLYMKKTGFGYISEQGRLNGIRLEGAISASEDTLVTLNGTVKTTSGGEKYIEVASITSGDPATVNPLGSVNTNLASPFLDGLFVTAWGTVMTGSVTSNSFIITDGSGSAGIMVITDGAPGVSEGSYVTLRGAAGTDFGARVIYKK